MLKNSNYEINPFAFGDEYAAPTIGLDFGEAKSTLEVDGTGKIRVINTGGSSASEGGMGNDNMDDKAKGELRKTGEKAGESMRGDETEEDTAFDPIKKSVREAERAADKE
jgi:hypothetical protein